MDTATNASVTDLLRRQHEEVRQLFAQLVEAPGDRRGELFDRLRATLAVHETAEEIAVHPVARRIGDVAARVVEARLAEEGKAKTALAELEKLSPAGEGFGPKLLLFRQDVEHHAAAEETELFPLLEAHRDQDTLARMAGAVLAAERLAPTHPHPHGPESAIGNLVVGPFAAMADRVRDALSERTGNSG